MALEFRSIGTDLKPDDSGFRFQGYAAVFNTDSRGLDFTETILPGAFNRSISAATRGEWEVKAFQDHDPKMFLGSTRTGSLSLSEDKLGLSVDLQLNPEVSYARDLAANLRRDGAGAGMSFGFTTPRMGDEWSSDGSRRELKSVKLHEVSVIVGGTPAYEATVGLASVRSVARLAKLDPEEVRTALSGLISGKLDAERAATVRAMLGALAPEPEVAPEVAQEILAEISPETAEEFRLQVKRLQLSLYDLRHPGHGDQSSHNPRKGAGAMGGGGVAAAEADIKVAEGEHLDALQKEGFNEAGLKTVREDFVVSNNNLNRAYLNPNKKDGAEQLQGYKSDYQKVAANHAANGIGRFSKDSAPAKTAVKVANAKVNFIDAALAEIQNRP